MPVPFQMYIKSGSLSHIRSFIFNSHKLSPHDVTHETIYPFRKETTSQTEEERAWNIPSFAASMTIEASLCLTVFLVFFVSLCQLFLVMQLQLRVQKVLEQVGSEVAQYCYLSSQIPLWKSDSQLIREVEEYLLAELSEEAIRLRFLELIGAETRERSLMIRGEEGISFEESSLLKEHHRLRLIVRYQVRLPVTLLGVEEITLRQQCYRYGLLGDKEPSQTVKAEEKMVYVTKNRQVYHLTLSCTYLNLSIRSVSMSQVAGLRNDSGGKYYPCERCRPTGREEAVYLTEDGDRYHDEGDCEGLRRHISAVPISEAEDLRPCSRCGKEK